MVLYHYAWRASDTRRTSARNAEEEMAYQRRLRANLAEITPPDRFVYGFDRVEMLGGNARVVPYVLRQDADGQNVPIEVEPSLVFPETQVLRLISLLLAAVGKPVAVASDGTLAVMH